MQPVMGSSLQMLNHHLLSYRTIDHPLSVPITPFYEISIWFDGIFVEKREKEPCTLRHQFRFREQSNQFTNQRLQTELLGWWVWLWSGSAMIAGFTPIHIKGFQGRKRSCGLLNSMEESVMIEANLCIARLPYKSTVWKPHLPSWLISTLQALECPPVSWVF